MKSNDLVVGYMPAYRGGLHASNTLVVWGNGGFRSSSQGHAPGPNKKLQAQLPKYVPLVAGRFGFGVCIVRRLRVRVTITRLFHTEVIRMADGTQL